MTAPRPVFDEAAFHSSQRGRLCSPRRMRPFAGVWAEALVQEIDRLLPNVLRKPVNSEAIVDCFAQTPTAKVERLLHALFAACKSHQPAIDGVAATWATELTIYAAMRAIDKDLLVGISRWQGDGAAASASVEYVPTSSSLIAFISMAALHGLVIRLDNTSAPSGALDLSGQMTSTGVEAELLKRLFDQLLKDKVKRRKNIYDPLTQDELGQLRTWFSNSRLDGQLSALYVRLPNLDVITSEGINRALAQLLNTRVIAGHHQHDDTLVLGETELTVASLKARVEQIFRWVPYFAQPDLELLSVPSNPAPPAPVAPTFAFDAFISHASEDKEKFVDALAKGLESLGLKIWYDTAEVRLGDNLIGSIGAGLRKSRFCIVVLSPNFFAKHWPQAEMTSALNEEFGDGHTRVLPIWLDVDKAAVQLGAPMLAQKLAVSAKGGLPAVLSSLLIAIKHNSPSSQSDTTA
jgi:TIR domain